MTDVFAAFSAAAAARVQAAAPHVACLEWGTNQSVSALLLGDGLAVSTEQSLPEADAYTAILPGGAKIRAMPAGRDPSTNVAALRLEASTPAPPEPTAALAVGALVLALGADGAGSPRAALGMIQTLGPAWQSQRGGRIDRLIRLDATLPRAAEGGPVIDATGGLVGMSTFGPRGQVLVIPAATIARVVAQLAAHGRVPRGWLGVGVQPVAVPRDTEFQGGCGLMVLSIADDAPAKGVLLPGDILLAAGEIALGSPRALLSLLTADAIGTMLDLRVLRGGAITRVSVAVTERPA